MRDTSWLKTARPGVYVAGSHMNLQEGSYRGLLLAGFSEEYAKKKSEEDWCEATGQIVDTLNDDLYEQGREDVAFAWENGDLVLVTLDEETEDEDYIEPLQDGQYMQSIKPLAKMRLMGKKCVIDIVGGITVIREEH